jgi:hypothetical protein
MPALFGPASLWSFPISPPCQMNVCSEPASSIADVNRLTIAGARLDDLDHSIEPIASRSPHIMRLWFPARSRSGWPRPDGLGGVEVTVAGSVLRSSALTICRTVVAAGRSLIDLPNRSQSALHIASPSVLGMDRQVLGARTVR